MVYVFGIDVPVIPLMFGILVGGAVVFGLLVYSLVRSAYINRKLELVLAKEREDVLLLERALARQEETIRRVEKEFLRIEHPAKVAAGIPSAEAIEKLRAELSMEKEKKPTAGEEIRRLEKGIGRRFKSFIRKISGWLVREEKEIAKIERKVGEKVAAAENKVAEKFVEVERGLEIEAKGLQKIWKGLRRVVPLIVGKVAQGEKRAVVRAAERLEKGVESFEESVHGVETAVGKEFHRAERGLFGGLKSRIRAIKKRLKERGVGKKAAREIPKVSKREVRKAEEVGRRVEKEAERLAKVVEEEIVESGKLIEKGLEGVYTCLHCSKMHYFKVGERVSKCDACGRQRFRRGGAEEQARAISGRV